MGLVVNVAWIEVERREVAFVGGGDFEIEEFGDRG